MLMREQDAGECQDASYHEHEDKRPIACEDKKLAVLVCDHGDRKASKQQAKWYRQRDSWKPGHYRSGNLLKIAVVWTHFEWPQQKICEPGDGDHKEPSLRKCPAEQQRNRDHSDMAFTQNWNEQQNPDQTQVKHHLAWQGLCPGDDG